MPRVQLRHIRALEDGPRQPAQRMITLYRTSGFSCRLSGLLGSIRLKRRDFFRFKSFNRREFSVDVWLVAQAT